MGRYASPPPTATSSAAWAAPNRRFTCRARPRWQPPPSAARSPIPGSFQVSIMESILAGRIFKFGDNINSDVIIPGRYLIYIDRERLSQHAFEMLGEGFADKLRTFDILVAGRNFGGGSAREQAATAIQGLGIKAIVACSFARTFYRNAINDGLPIVECPALVAAVNEGDEIQIDLEAGKIHF